MTPEPIRSLVVEDDFMVAAVHRGYLETLPEFEVVGEAHSGTDALRAVEDLRPDLILLDIYLPDISGLEVLRRVRQLPEPIDIIAVTAAREVETVRHAMAGGVAHYLVKPFSLGVFQDRLRAYARQRRDLLRRTARGQRVLDQAEVDRLLAGRHRGTAPELPKGLSPATLALVSEALRHASGELSASEAADRCGLSRVSARRYLEYLVAAGLAEMRPRYGAAGRPEHGYRWAAPDPAEPGAT